MENQGGLAVAAVHDSSAEGSSSSTDSGLKVIQEASVGGNSVPGLDTYLPFYKADLEDDDITASKHLPSHEQPSSDATTQAEGKQNETTTPTTTPPKASTTTWLVINEHRVQHNSAQNLQPGGQPRAAAKAISIKAPSNRGNEGRRRGAHESVHGWCTTSLGGE